MVFELRYMGIQRLSKGQEVLEKEFLILHLPQVLFPQI